MRLVCAVVGVLVVKLQRGQCADEIDAIRKYPQPCAWVPPLVRVRRQPLVQVKPPLHPVVVRLDQIHPVLRKKFRRALAAVLPAVPQVGRGDILVDFLALGRQLPDARRRVPDDMTGPVFAPLVVPALV